jgi:hypothetical protein
MEANSEEAYFNISYNLSDIHFEGLFKNRPLKFFGVCFACLSIIIMSFLCYGIIWFERFGSGK